MSDPFPDDAWPPVPDGVLTVVYAIYERPLDHPDGWVVRRWFVMDGEDQPIADVVPRFAYILDEARRHVPPDLIRVTSPGDDPFLFESWI